MKDRVWYNFLFTSALSTFLEFFDLALYSFCSAIIVKHFFPTTDNFITILASWVVFAISYVMRPLGALWLGYIADVYSSRRAMVLSLALMGVATIAMGLLPCYSQIGILAPVILLLLRIMQSVAVSSAYNLPSIFIKNNNRFQNHFGLVSSISAAVAGLGMMTAIWVMSRILNSISLNDIPEYFWRIPFILSGILVGIVGVYVCGDMNERARKPMLKATPLSQVLKLQGMDFLKAAFLVGYIGCITYALFGYFVYMLGHILHMPLEAALHILGGASFILPVFCILAGYCSDRIPRHILMLVSVLLVAASGYCLFSFMHVSSLTTIKIQLAIMLCGLGFFSGSVPGYIGELFAQEYRYTGSFLAYNVGMSWIGGISYLLFVTLAKINFKLPIAIIVIYSILVMLLVARPLVEFGAKQTDMV